MDLKDVQKEIDARWGSSAYSAEFNARPDEQRDAHHATLHITKALGKVASALDDLDHGTGINVAEVRSALADIVICTGRVASRLPRHPIDLGEAVRSRIKAKFPPNHASAEAIETGRPAREAQWEWSAELGCFVARMGLVELRAYPNGSWWVWETEQSKADGQAGSVLEAMLAAIARERQDTRGCSSYPPEIDAWLARLEASLAARVLRTAQECRREAIGADHPGLTEFELACIAMRGDNAARSSEEMLTYCALGIAEEAREVALSLGGDAEQALAEIGDVAWHATTAAHYLGFTVKDIRSLRVGNWLSVQDAGDFHECAQAMIWCACRFAGLLKKSVFHAAPLDRKSAAICLAEIFALAELLAESDAVGHTLEDAFAANAEKNRKRFPSGGFTAAEALARVDETGGAQ